MLSRAYSASAIAIEALRRRAMSRDILYVEVPAKSSPHLPSARRRFSLLLETSLERSEPRSDIHWHAIFPSHRMRNSAAVSCPRRSILAPLLHFRRHRC